MKIQRKTLTAALILFLALSLRATTFYVNISNAVPLTPYTNWLTAATDIQSAIDIATNGDLILVTNGVYNTGGRIIFGALTNRVAINKTVTVQSVNGPLVTTIQGNSNLNSSAIRCVYMTNNSTLSGFTLMNGGTLPGGDTIQERRGGGVWANSTTTSIVTNCVLIGNAASFYGGGIYQGYVLNSVITQNRAPTGGGTAFSTLINSLVTSNTASQDGGGAYTSSLYGCIMIGNIAQASGGAIYSGQTVQNCIIIANSAQVSSGGVSGATGSGANPAFRNNIVLNNIVNQGSTSNYTGVTFAINCCTLPMPPSGLKNITNDPIFVDYAGGNFRLQSNSPCINSGASQTFIAADLDGNNRLADGLVDIGAYEYQDSHFVLPLVYAQQYGFSLDGSIDSDGDGVNNWSEAIAETNPTNAASYFTILYVTNPVASSKLVRWQSVQGKRYTLLRSTNLVTQPEFSIIRTNVTSMSTGPLSTGDITATNGGPYFYRVMVQP